MSLPTKTKNVTVGHVNFKFTCTPEPSETEYLDTQVYIQGSYFCTITWLDLDKFIEEIQRAVGTYAI
jgi:hypothetical protein